MRPIIFSGPMVRAILGGRKTQTRRLVGIDTLQPSTTPGYDWTFRGKAPVKSIAQQRRHPEGCWQDCRHADFLRLCPHGVPGDRLWVRETWRESIGVTGDELFYAADMSDYDRREKGPWCPSLFMKRTASRITLEITDVRVLRLQDISDDDARAEGVIPTPFCKAGRPAGLEHVEAFESLWDGINAKRAPWVANPWVWAVTFVRMDEKARAA
jgi:hypothetical protein